MGNPHPDRIRTVTAAHHEPARTGDYRPLDYDPADEFTAEDLAAELAVERRLEEGSEPR